MFTPVSVLAVAVASWFGPAPASFDSPVQGSPYDFGTNDARVVFTADDGHREERLAYYDEGGWHAWLTTAHPGRYHAALLRNGAPVEGPGVVVEVPESARRAEGFVRTAGTGFCADAGSPYYPLGYNLGWAYPGQPSIPAELQRMGAAGMNWTRIWACAWDGKNPFFTRGLANPPAGDILPAVAAQWDGIVAAAESSGVRLQLVLFHHGLFSTRNDSNWAEHPWNRANGGFLERPQDFFTDPTAKEYAKRWLRYAVARWGHSPAIMAWELFNEVEWVDLVQIDHNWPAVIGWHAEMAAFLREIDPYHHLVVTSAAAREPELYRAMDYYQPHTYPRDVFTGIAGLPMPTDKPWFFGEFGRGTWEQNADEHLVVRDGIWAGFLSGHAGAAQYWFWDRVGPLGLEPEFSRAARVLALSGLPERLHDGAKPVAVTVGRAAHAPLKIAPGRGWGATDRGRFELPGDAIPKNLVEWSAYLTPLAGEHAGLMRAPLEFVFTLADAGEAEIVFTSLSAKGSGVRVWLDGEVAVEAQWPAAADAVESPTGGRRHQPAPPPLRVPLANGRHVLRLACTGPDWVQLDHLRLPELGSAVRAHAIGDREWLLARLEAEAGALGSRVDLCGTGLADGEYRLHVIDLETGAEQQRTVVLAEGALLELAVSSRDTALILGR